MTLVNAGRGNPNRVALEPRAALFLLGEFAVAESRRVALGDHYPLPVRMLDHAERLKLIDRMVADCRAIGLNHTAGLSTPQQAQTTLFALDGLLDAEDARKAAARELLRGRFERLYRGAGLVPPADPLLTHYYTSLDMPALARARYGDAFARRLVASFELLDDYHRAWLNRRAPPAPPSSAGPAPRSRRRTGWRG